MENKPRILDVLIPNHFPLLEDFLDSASKMFIKDDWITLYDSSIFAVMATDDVVDKESLDDSWAVNSFSMRPSFKFDDGNSVSGYIAYPDENVFPIVITQTEKCYHSERVRLIDEFVLFYDLRIVERIDGTIDYYRVDETGEDTLIAKVRNGSLQIVASYIKEFLAIKNLNLIIQFEAYSYSNKSVEEFGNESPYQLYKAPGITFSYSLTSATISTYKSSSFIRGKCFIRHEVDNIKRLWDSHDCRFESFIAGVDESGKPLLSTCDERKLKHMGNYVSNEPWQMSLVFFKREVLNKYYSDTKKYSVMDGAITGPEWFAHLDSDRNDGYVVMALKDLGKMPYKEQVHWKGFNVEYPTNGGLSDTTVMRWIEGKPSDTKNAPDLKFKSSYDAANIKWNEKYGFPLYLPLAPGDEHFYYELHSMNELNNDSVFDGTVLAFTKVTIDSLNEKELLKNVDENNTDVIALCERCQVKDGKVSNLSGGIRKFEAFMYSKGIYNESLITLLNKVQALRSSTAAHRKTTDPKKKDIELNEWFGLDKYPHRDVVDDIFYQYINHFEWVIASCESGTEESD